MFDFRQSEWPVSIAIDLLASEDKNNPFGETWKDSTTEVDLGIRKIGEIADSFIKPYISGVAFINAEMKNTTRNFSDDDNSTGYWLNGGVYLTLSESVNLGIELRY